MNQFYTDPPPIYKEQELAYALLVLERQLNAYQRLHQEDLVALRSDLEELKDQVLARGVPTAQNDPASTP